MQFFDIRSLDAVLKHEYSSAGMLLQLMAVIVSDYTQRQYLGLLVEDTDKLAVWVYVHLPSFWLEGLLKEHTAYSSVFKFTHDREALIVYALKDNPNISEIATICAIDQLPTEYLPKD